jgi:hypothetical protein
MGGYVGKTVFLEGQLVYNPESFCFVPVEVNLQGLYKELNTYYATIKAVMQYSPSV